jgi:hypothetical protein
MNIYRTFSIIAVVSTIAIAVFFVASVVKTDNPELKPVANAAPEVVSQVPKATPKISSSVSTDNLLSTFDVDSAQEESFPADNGFMFNTTERISYAGTQSGWDGSNDSYQPETFDSFEFGQPAASSSYSSFVSSGGDSAGSSSTDFSSTGSSGSSSSSGGSSSGSAEDPASDSSGSEGASPETPSDGSGDNSGTDTPSTDSGTSDNPPQSGGGGAGVPTEGLLLENLRQLQPLPKIHYSWGIPGALLDNRNEPLMYELARLSHSLSIGTSPLHNEAVLSSRVDNCVYTCARINKTNPDIPCSIALTYSPWHWKFMPNLGSPIPGEYNHTIFTDRTYRIEIEEFVLRMTFLKQQVDKCNQKYGTDVKISAILLDCERFSPRKNDTFWNQGMAKALDDIHIEAANLFPDARIEWYSRGMGGYTIASLSEWYSYFTRQEKYIPTLSYAHHVVPDFEFMRQTLIKTCQLGDSLGIEDVTPWLGLAWGRKRLVSGEVIFEAWDYDMKYSYQAGQELNDFCKGVRAATYPPYNRVKAVILYTPFDSNIPAFGKHFVDYCKGAAQANSQ